MLRWNRATASKRATGLLPASHNPILCKILRRARVAVPPRSVVVIASRGGRAGAMQGNAAAFDAAGARNWRPGIRLRDAGGVMARPTAHTLPVPVAGAVSCRAAAPSRRMKAPVSANASSAPASERGSSEIKAARPFTNTYRACPRNRRPRVCPTASCAWQARFLRPIVGFSAHFAPLVVRAGNDVPGGSR